MRNDTLSRLDSGGTLTVLALLMDGPQEGMPFEGDETERAVRELQEIGLIRSTGNDECGRTLYGLTDKGRGVGLKVLELDCTLGDGRGQIPEPDTRRQGRATLVQRDQSSPVCDIQWVDEREGPLIEAQVLPCPADGDTIGFHLRIESINPDRESPIPDCLLNGRAKKTFASLMR